MINTYAEAAQAFNDILEMMSRDGQLKTSYTTVANALKSTLQRLAFAEIQATRRLEASSQE